MRLTEKAVAALKAGHDRKQYFDDTQAGFGIRVEPSGRKAFLWYAKVNGKPRMKALGEFPLVSVSDARAAADKWAGIAAQWKLAGYAPPDPFAPAVKPAPAASNVPTFKMLLEAYITQHIWSADTDERANNPAKAEYMARHLAKHFAAIHDRALDAIEVEDILAVKRACGERHYLANRCVELCRALFNWSAKSKDGVRFFACDNPAREVSTYGEKSRTRFLSPEEIIRFNEALTDEPSQDLKDFLVLAMNTGARKMDILSMRWQDISMDAARWTVPFSKSGSYNVDLHAAALAVLERRQSEAVQDAIFVFPSHSASGHLEDVKKVWNEFRTRAQLPTKGEDVFRCHDIRRTVGSFAAIAGVSLQQIGAMLGHRSLQSTQVYARLSDTATREAREVGANKMAELVKAAEQRAKANARKQRKALPAAKPPRKAKLALVS